MEEVKEMLTLFQDFKVKKISVGVLIEWLMLYGKLAEEFLLIFYLKVSQPACRKTPTVNMFTIKYKLFPVLKKIYDFSHINSVPSALFCHYLWSI